MWLHDQVINKKNILICVIHAALVLVLRKNII